jgi:hypothetical protein
MLVIGGRRCIEMFMNIIKCVINVKRINNFLTENLAKLVTTLFLKPFQKWGLDFIKHVRLASRMSSNMYI